MWIHPYVSLLGKEHAISVFLSQTLNTSFNHFEFIYPASGHNGKHGLCFFVVYILLFESNGIKTLNLNPLLSRYVLSLSFMNSMILCIESLYALIGLWRSMNKHEF